MVKISKAFALSANQGSSQKASPKYIIAHDTGNDNNKGKNSAKNEAAYMKSHWNAAYTHMIVDDTMAYLVGGIGYVAWGAGNANPDSPFQIELAHVNSQARFNKSYANYVELLRKYAKKYNIPLSLDAGGAGTKGIKSHKWVSDHIWGDHQDPYAYLAKWGISKAQFAKDLKNGIKSSSKSKKASYWKSGDTFKVITSKVNAYDDIKFTNKNGKSFTKNSVLKGTIEKYGSITRLKTDCGYVSTNTKFIKKIK